MATPTLTGIWRGQVKDFKFCLDLIQVKDHVNGLLIVGGFTKSGHVVGVNHHPEVMLSGSFLRVGAAFNGYFVNDNRIRGTLRFQDDVADITFRRDPDAKTCAG